LSSPDNPRLDSQMDSQSPASFDPPVPSAPDSYSLDPGGLPAQAPAPLFPAENPVWNGWDVLALTGVTVLSMFVFPLFVLLGARAFFYPHASLIELAQRPILLLIAQFLLYIPVGVFMAMLVKAKDRAPFWQAIRWNWPHSVWRLLALGAGMFFVLGLLQNLLPMPKDTPFDHLFDNPRDAYVLSVLAITIGPLMEELFFRGFLYPVLARRMGITWGIILTALPFGLIHLQQYGWAWAAGLVIFLVGVVCGAVRAITKSVGASFLVHVGYNGVQMILAIVVTHGFLRMDKATIWAW
jgi:uncharacterized protein